MISVIGLLLCRMRGKRGSRFGTTSQGCAGVIAWSITQHQPGAQLLGLGQGEMTGALAL